MDNLNKLNPLLNLPPTIEETLKNEIKKVIDKSGMFYRIFSRIKTAHSVEKKLSNPKYCSEHKLQDLIGVRIVMYFKDDVELCKKIIERRFDVDNISQDINDEETFKPTRLNIVCKLPENVKELIEKSLFEDYFIDPTFEIQLRTVFSEGWHEIEHDFRYKFGNEWLGEMLDYSRALNGIFATLETCDRAIVDILKGFAYEKYKKRSWDAMIRNKFRIRLSLQALSGNIKGILDKKVYLSKAILNIDRTDLLEKFAFEKIGHMPKHIDNIVYIANALYIKDEEIDSITPTLVKEFVDLI